MLTGLPGVSSGTPAASYSTAQVAGRLRYIDVAESLSGRWHYGDGVDTEGVTPTLADVTGPYYAGEQDGMSDESIRAALGMSEANMDAQFDSVGAGEFLIPLTIKTSAGAVVPLCRCVITTTSDSDTNNILVRDYSNDAGKFETNLNAGTYYLWRQKDGFTFSDPATVTVASDGGVTIS